MTLVCLFNLAILLVFSQAGFTASKAEIDAEIKAALDQLYKTTPAAKELASKAKGILVFPSIVKQSKSIKFIQIFCLNFFDFGEFQCQKLLYVKEQELL